MVTNYIIQIGYFNIVGVIIGLCGAVILIYSTMGKGIEINNYVFLVISATVMYAISINVIKKYLYDLDLWIVGLLRDDPHPSHAGFDQIIEYINYIKPKKTIFTHMTALLDEKKLLSKCPLNTLPGVDGMEIEI